MDNSKPIKMRNPYISVDQLEQVLCLLEDMGL